MTKLTHINDHGKANMVDVSNKPIEKREATASGHITLMPGTIHQIQDNSMKKGDVLTVARVAGIQAAKQTPALIPLCHPLMLNKIDVDTRITDQGVDVVATVVCQGQTGVEMEALTAVSVALLTIYDMCKAVDKSMVIGNISLINKTKTALT